MPPVVPESPADAKASMQQQCVNEGP